MIIAYSIFGISVTNAQLVIGNNNRSNFNANSLSNHNLEANCTNAVSKVTNESMTGLYCRLNNGTLNVYLALSDEALLEISKDKNAQYNLQQLRSTFVNNSCKRDSYLVSGSVNSVQIHLVDKFRKGLIDYEIKRSDCL